MEIDIITKKEFNSFKIELFDRIEKLIGGNVNKAYLSKEEALSLLNCSSRTLDELRSDRKISFYKIGREFSYETQSLIHLIERNMIRVVE
ncbi:MAG: hypothetical protein U9N59_07095 [Campylobacterota bacterium]|nr:hypothetical protein [Campylobacterota bacterium]